MPIDSTEGHWGDLDDIVVDPRDWRITHLVVQPHHHHERSRLVPIEAVTSCDDRVVLSWAPSQIEAAPPVETTDFVTVEHPTGNDWHFDSGTSRSWPYFPYAGSTFGFVGAYDIRSGLGDTSDTPSFVATTFDHVPDGLVEIRRTSEVVSSDDHVVGTVDGFLFEPDGGVTHLVLERGHLWGHRDVMIPLEHVVAADREQVTLDLPRHAVGELPSVPFRRPGRVAA
jgi:uncharacterized protein YrrD